MSAPVREMLLVTNDLDNYLPYGLSLLVIIVVALFICMLTLAVGLAYMHRHRSNSSVRSRSTFGSKHRQLMTSSSTYALAPTTCTVIQPGSDATDVIMTTTCPTSQNASPVKSNTLPTRLGPHAVVLPADGVIVSGMMSGTGPGSCSSPTQRRIVHVNFSPRTAPRCLEHARHTFDDEIIACVNRPIVDTELTEPWLQQQQQHSQICGGCCSATPSNVFAGSDHPRKCTCTGGADHSNVASSPVNALHQQCLHPTAILDLPPPPPPPTLPKPPTTLMFTTFKPVPPIDSWDDSNVNNVSVTDEWSKTARSPTTKMRISKDVMKPKN